MTLSSSPIRRAGRRLLTLGALLAGDRRRWWPGLLLVALTVGLAACTSSGGQRSTPSTCSSGA